MDVSGSLASIGGVTVDTYLLASVLSKIVEAVIINWPELI
jgi:hypothetical protein